MGIKTTVNDKGVVTEKIAGTGITFVVDGKTVNNVFNAPVDGSVTLDNVNDPFVVVEANSVDVTASLPAVSAELVGTTYTVINADTTAGLALSGTNPINGSDWELDVSARRISVVAVSSSAYGYSWEQLF
jgi:hypothetical protein